MTSKKATEKYVAFLRGINVGGRHKLPMADLRKELQQLGFEQVTTLLNSGNVIFHASIADEEALEKMISEKLQEAFGFPVPTIIRKPETIDQLFKANPFKEVKITKDIRLYISFLKKDVRSDLELPWSSPDDSYKIIEKKEKNILSILDLSISKTPKAMDALEKFYGKGITTRNWKTIERIIKKL